MWTCPKCESKVDASFEICWSCGTSVDGVEDPDFQSADEADPIEKVPVPIDVIDKSLSDFDGVPPCDLVSCYWAETAFEAKFIADQLVTEGIPAIADESDLGMMIGGWKPSLWVGGPRVRIRPVDLPRATEWIKSYEERHQRKRNES